ncbi:MAG TPA: hypothetical protein VL947_07690 [Cytophagales bacterium]|nr:hypothetical protein [Cytophagales bacterium]
MRKNKSKILKKKRTFLWYRILKSYMGFKMNTLVKKAKEGNIVSLFF